MVIVGKANGEPRQVVDFQPLNRHATRETHHTKSQARSVPKEVKKSVFDAWNSVPLHPEDALHYVYHALGTVPLPDRPPPPPQGYKASGDGHTADWLRRCGANGIILSSHSPRFHGRTVTRRHLKPPRGK